MPERLWQPVRAAGPSELEQLEGPQQSDGDDREPHGDANRRDPPQHQQQHGREHEQEAARIEHHCVEHVAADRCRHPTGHAAEGARDARQRAQRTRNAGPAATDVGPNCGEREDPRARPAQWPRARGRCVPWRARGDSYRASDDGRFALPAATAQGRGTELRAAAPELVDEREHHTRAGRADRVTERDRAAVHVHVGVVDAQIADRCERDGGERLVDLDEFEVADLLADLVERVHDRGDGWVSSDGSGPATMP